MPKKSALQFAADGKFSQVRAFAGDVLYTEGMPASRMYLVVDGEVDLYLLRDEKRVVIETLGKGQYFGIEPHLSLHTRTHSAAARTYCELVLVDPATMDRAMGSSHPLVHGALVALSERLSAAHELIAERVNHQPELLIYAQLLQLAGQASLAAQGAGRPGHRPRGFGHSPAPQPARTSMQEVVNHARALFGHSDRHARLVLGKFVSLHLVRVEEEHGAGKQLLYAPQDIVAQVRKVVADDADTGKLRHEYLSLEEFAALVEVDRSVLLKKLADDEFAEDLFTFRRDEVMSLLNRKGRRYFAERQGKAPADFADIADIEFADHKSIFAVVSQMDTYDLAKVLSALGEGDARRKILGAMTARRRRDVEQDLEDLADVDPVETQHLASTLIGHVKAAMLQKAA